MMCATLFSLASCSSDPQWADEEAHEKTVLLNEQYGPLLVGTWHIEKIGEKQRYFERLTFTSDGTLTGERKWQNRKFVTIDGNEQYTDWEDVELSGTFKGTWQLRYWSPEGNSGEKRNCLQLTATYDDAGRRREAQLPATDRHLRRCRARLHGLLLHPHLRLRRRHHPPHPRLLRQRPRRLDQLPARRGRTKYLKRHLIKSNRECIK